MIEVRYGEYVISDDKARLNPDIVRKFLSQSYWANTRSVENILRSIENSVCYGVYHAREQVGFARIVTDSITVYYLCDVYVDQRYRGQGIGKKLVEVIVHEFQDLRGILGTKDAHGLYEQFGFVRNPERFMTRQPGPAITDWVHSGN